MHKGFRMMLEALGIHIDPAEIESLFLKLKQDIPALAQYFEKQFSSLDMRLDRIERLLAGEKEGVSNSSVSSTRSLAPEQLLTPAELTMWEGEEIEYREMRDILIKRLVAIRRQKAKEAINGHSHSNANVS